MAGNIPPTPPPATDQAPRYAQFLAAAASMVAMERGLTTICRAKLATIAENLGLDENEFQAALAKLQLEAIEPDPPPLAIAWNTEKFRKYVGKKLSKLQVPVLTPDQEDRLVAIAAKRYALPELPARQVVDEVARDRIVRRIDRSIAEKNVMQRIEKIVGDSAHLNQPLWERVWKATQAWGVTEERLRTLVDQQLESNRQTRLSEQRWRTAALLASVLAALFVIAMTVAIYSRRDPAVAVSNNDLVTKKDAVDVSVVPAESKRHSHPAWWNTEMALRIAEVRRDHSDFSPILLQLASESPNVRAKGYEQLFDWLQKNPAAVEERHRVGLMLLDFYSLEPDEAAVSRICQRLWRMASVARGELPKRSNDCALAFWATKVAVEGSDKPKLSVERAKALSTLLESVLQTSLDTSQSSAELQRHCLAALSEQFYWRLIDAASKQPQLVSELQPIVSRYAEQNLPTDELERIEVLYLSAALLPSGAGWVKYRDLIARCVAAKRAPNLLKMVQLYENLTDEKLQKFMGQLLIARTGIQADSLDVREIARAMRQTIRPNFPSSTTENDVTPLHVERLAKQFLQQPRENAKDVIAILKETRQAAHFANAVLAVAQGNRSPEQLEKLLDDATNLALLDETRPREFSVSGTRRSPTSEKINEMKRRNAEQQFETLANFELILPVKRYVALKSIANALPEIGELTATQGAIIAKYLLASNTAQEHQQIQDTLPQFARDLQVRIGVADELPNSALKREELTTILKAFVGRDIKAHELAVPRSGLRREILRVAMLELPESAWSHRTPDMPAAIDVAQQSLAEIYRLRAGIIGVERKAAVDDFANVPISGVLAEIARRWSTFDNLEVLAEQHRKFVARVPFELEAIQYLGANDLVRTVLTQRLILQLAEVRLSSANRASDRYGVEENLNLNSQQAGARHILEQLRDGEIALLRVALILPRSKGDSP